MPMNLVMKNYSLARAIYNNEAETPDELSFRKGDVVTVLEQNSSGLQGWWLCCLKGRQGIAPGNRLRLIPGKFDPTGLGYASCSGITSGSSANGNGNMNTDITYDTPISRHHQERYRDLLHHQLHHQSKPRLLRTRAVSQSFEVQTFIDRPFNHSCSSNSLSSKCFTKDDHNNHQATSYDYDYLNNQYVDHQVCHHFRHQCKMNNQSNHKRSQSADLLSSKCDDNVDGDSSRRTTPDDISLDQLDGESSYDVPKPFSYNSSDNQVISCAGRSSPATSSQCFGSLYDVPPPVNVNPILKNALTYDVPSNLSLSSSPTSATHLSSSSASKPRDRCFSHGRLNLLSHNHGSCSSSSGTSSSGSSSSLSLLSHGHNHSHSNPSSHRSSLDASLSLSSFGTNSGSNSSNRSSLDHDNGLLSVVNLIQDNDGQEDANYDIPPEPRKVATTASSALHALNGHINNHNHVRNHSSSSIYSSSPKPNNLHGCDNSLLLSAIPPPPPSSASNSCIGSNEKQSHIKASGHEYSYDPYSTSSNHHIINLHKTESYQLNYLTPNQLASEGTNILNFSPSAPGSRSGSVSRSSAHLNSSSPSSAKILSQFYDIPSNNNPISLSSVVNNDNEYDIPRSSRRRFNNDLNDDSNGSASCLSSSAMAENASSRTNIYCSPNSSSCSLSHLEQSKDSSSRDINCYSNSNPVNNEMPTTIKSNCNSKSSPRSLSSESASPSLPQSSNHQQVNVNYSPFSSSSSLSLSLLSNHGSSSSSSNSSTASNHSHSNLSRLSLLSNDSNNSSINSSTYNSMKGSKESLTYAPLIDPSIHDRRETYSAVTSLVEQSVPIKLTYSISEALETELTSTQAVLTAITDVFKFVTGTNWRAIDNLAGRVEHLELACHSLKDAIKQFRWFCQAALANASHSSVTDKTLAAKLIKLLKQLSDSYAIIDNSLSIIDSKGWSLERLAVVFNEEGNEDHIDLAQDIELSNSIVKKNGLSGSNLISCTSNMNKKKSSPPTPDELDQLIAVARGLGEDVKHAGSFIRGNVKLIFNPEIQLSELEVNHNQLKITSKPPIAPKPCVPAKPSSLSFNHGQGLGYVHGRKAPLPPPVKTPLQSRPLPPVPHVDLSLINPNSIPTSPDESDGPDYDYINLERGLTKEIQMLGKQDNQEKNGSNETSSEQEKLTIKNEDSVNLRDKTCESNEYSRLSSDTQSIDSGVGKDASSGSGSGSDDGSSCPNMANITSSDEQLINYYSTHLENHSQTFYTSLESLMSIIKDNQPPKIFMAQSKIVVISGKRLVFIGDSVANHVANQELKAKVFSASNHLCSSLKTLVIKTKTAATQFPDVTAVQDMIQSGIKVKESVEQLNLSMDLNVNAVKCVETDYRLSSSRDTLITPKQTFQQKT